MFMFHTYIKNKQQPIRHKVIYKFRNAISLFFIPWMLSTLAIPAFAKTSESTEIKSKQFLPIDCWFDLPGDLPSHLSVECGQWHTKSDSTNSSATNFKLKMVILRDHSQDHQQDPLFYLSGGPGSSTYLEPENVDSWFYWFEIAKLSRDIILVDQRGTGLSRPKFECDNYLNFLRSSLRNDQPIEDDYQQAFETIKSCLQKAKRKGYQESEYSTSHSAKDMNAIAQTLGYKQWNIMGGSYGTRLGLEWMRQNPQQIRSAVLDSVYPLNKGLLEEWPETTHNALNYFWQRCAKTETCREHFDYQSFVSKSASVNTSKNTSQSASQSGSRNSSQLEYSEEQIANALELAFWSAVDILSENPQTVTVPLWYGDWPLKTVINGNRFISLMYQALYDDALQDDIVKLIQSVNANTHTETLKKLAENAINSELAKEFNVLTYFAVDCREMPAPIKKDFDQQLDRYNQLQHYAEFAFQYDPCQLFEKREDLKAFRQPVKSNIPTLILSGGYDPVTPTAWAEEVSQRLSNAVLWFMPDVGHGVVNSNVCVHQSLRRFLDKPQSFKPSNC